MICSECLFSITVITALQNLIRVPRTSIQFISSTVSCMEYLSYPAVNSHIFRNCSLPQIFMTILFQSDAFSSCFMCLPFLPYLNSLALMSHLNNQIYKLVSFTWMMFEAIWLCMLPSIISSIILFLVNRMCLSMWFCTFKCHSLRIWRTVGVYCSNIQSCDRSPCWLALTSFHAVLVGNVMEQTEWEQDITCGVPS